MGLETYRTPSKYKININRIKVHEADMGTYSKVQAIYEGDRKGKA